MVTSIVTATALLLNISVRVICPRWWDRIRSGPASPVAGRNGLHRPVRQGGRRPHPCVPHRRQPWWCRGSSRSTLSQYRRSLSPIPWPQCWWSEVEPAPHADRLQPQEAHGGQGYRQEHKSGNIHVQLQCFSSMGWSTLPTTTLTAPAIVSIIGICFSLVASTVFSCHLLHEAFQRYSLKYHTDRIPLSLYAMYSFN